MNVKITKSKLKNKDYLVIDDIDKGGETILAVTIDKVVVDRDNIFQSKLFHLNRRIRKITKVFNNFAPSLNDVVEKFNRNDTKL